MKNTASATCYKDDDSIATMEDELEYTAVKSMNYESHAGSMNLSHAGSNKTPAPIDMTKRADDFVHAEESSLTSVMTMESLAQRQNQKASRLDNIDAILSQILGRLK